MQRRRSPRSKEGNPPFWKEEEKLAGGVCVSCKSQIWARWCRNGEVFGFGVFFFRHRRQAGLQQGGCNLRPVAKRIGGRKSFIGFGALTGASYLSLPPLFMLPDADARYALAERQKKSWLGRHSHSVCVLLLLPHSQRRVWCCGTFFPTLPRSRAFTQDTTAEAKASFLLRRSRQLKARKVLFFVFFLLLW